MIVVTHNYPTEACSWAGIFVKEWLSQQLLRAFERGDIEWEARLIYAPLRPFGAALSSLARIAGIDKGQAIICHWWIPWGWLCAWWHPHRTHVICHGTDLRILDKHRLLAWLLRPFAHHVGKWQCVSEFLKEKLLDIYPFIIPADVWVEPMPLNPVFTNKVPWEDRGTMALHVGGPRKGESERTVATPEGEVAVMFVKDITQQALATYFNACKYYISTSDFEGYGMTLREAKACGCKIISYVGDGRTEEDVDIVLGRVG